MEADLTGVVLDGRYRVLEPISEGAMGVVYRAERLKLGRIVAVKVMHDQLPSELTSRKRFEIEATAMAKLEHPHCAAVIDVGVHEDQPFVVMDYVAGATLREIVAAGPLPVPRAVEIVRQVLSGLAHAHEQGIIHRDIKPANIIVAQKAGLGDHVKILDFGLARIADTPKVTTGIVVGTPAYMAPEQIRGTQVDHRADLYAAGVLLFELLTAHKPFVSAKDDPVEVCSMHLKQPPPTLAAMQPGIEFGPLEAIVAKALAKQPDDRYASAVELAAALDAVVPRRASAPAIPVPASAPVMATESGWVVPGSAPVPVPGIATGPTSPMPGIATGPSAAPLPVPEIATGPAAPVASKPADPVTPRPQRSTKAPPTPFASTRAKAPTSRPVASPSEPVVAERAPAGGLPADFDLSMAIPRGAPDGASAKGLSPAFDLSVAIPSPAVTVETAFQPVVVAEPTLGKGETKLGLGTVEPAKLPTPAAPKSTHDATAFFQGAPPAGPSPLEAADVPAMEAVSLPPPPLTLPALPITRKQLQIIGIGAGALLLLAIVIGTCSGGTSTPPTKPAPTTTTRPTPRSPTPEVSEPFTRASEQLAAGNPKGAISTLVPARAQAPKDARLAYLLGRAYFETKQGSLGLQQFRDTLALDGTYRADPLLIRAVLGAFNAASEYPAELGAFLRDEIGPPARQYLEETAAKHPSSKIRNRAKAELAKLR